MTRYLLLGVKDWPTPYDGKEETPRAREFKTWLIMLEWYLQQVMICWAVRTVYTYYPNRRIHHLHSLGEFSS